MGDFIENMSRDWWTEEIDMSMSRLGFMTLLGLVDLALRHPQIPSSTQENGREIGRQIFERMLEDGLELPKAVKDAYIETLYPLMTAKGSAEAVRGLQHSRPIDVLIVDDPEIR